MALWSIQISQMWHANYWSSYQLTTAAGPKLTGADTYGYHQLKKKEKKKYVKPNFPRCPSFLNSNFMQSGALTVLYSALLWVFMYILLFAKEKAALKQLCHYQWALKHLSLEILIIVISGRTSPSIISLWLLAFWTTAMSEILEQLNPHPTVENLATEQSY